MSYLSYCLFIIFFFNYFLSLYYLFRSALAGFGFSFDFGLSFGTGVSVPINNNSIFLEARYAFGLTNVFDLPSEPEIPDEECRNKGIKIFIGITFPLGAR